MTQTTDTLPKNFPSWFVEFYKRFGLTSPRFFQIIQYAGAAAVAIGFVPDILTYLSITPGPIFSKVLTTVLKAAGATAYIVSKLPTSNPNHVIQTTDNLPFTEKKQITGVDTVVLAKTA